MENLEKIKECPDCASMNVLYSQEREQLICRECGLIFEPLVPDIEEKFERVRGLISQSSQKRKENISKKKAKPANKLHKSKKKRR